MSRSQPRARRPAPFVLCLGLLALAACAAPNVTDIELMPPPGVYEDGVVDPFVDTGPAVKLPETEILYATLRRPATPDRPGSYSDEADAVLRVGVANIALGENNLTWEEARRISLLKNRADRYPVRIVSVDEFGPLAHSRHPAADPSIFAADPLAVDRSFAAAINDKLARSRNKDIYIYVHGFRVGFEKPVLVAAGLWHFLAYDGVFMAFSWPSATGLFSYFKGTEDSTRSSFLFRRFLLYLADETDARRIHIISHSAGTRMVAATIGHLGLLYHDTDPATIRERLRIGNVILIGSDLDPGILLGYILDGALNVPDELTIYASQTDRALNFSRRVFGGQARLGQTTNEPLPAHFLDFVRGYENLAVIDVTDAEDSDTESGHRYFHQSPWASSDILTSLAYGLGPAERGLVRRDDAFAWEFPPDYIARLRTALVAANPALAKGANEGLSNVGR